MTFDIDWEEEMSFPKCEEIHHVCKIKLLLNYHYILKGHESCQTHTGNSSDCKLSFSNYLHFSLLVLLEKLIFEIFNVVYAKHFLYRKEPP